MPSINDFEIISIKVAELANMVIGTQDKIDQRFIKIFEELANIKISLARLDERTASGKETQGQMQEITWKWVPLVVSIVAVAISAIFSILHSK